MKIKLIASLIALVATALTFAYPWSASAATRSAGTNIVSNGVVYMIASENGQTVKRPYTSAGAFNSYRFNRWNEVQTATMDEQSLPTGSYIPPRDGSIFCSDRGYDQGTCYLITLSKKAAFTSEAIFKGLGYIFDWAKTGDSTFMESTQNIDSITPSHRPGTLINKDGTVYLVTQSGIAGVPDVATLNSWGYWTTDIVTANQYDRYLSNVGTLPTRAGGQLIPPISTDDAKITIETTSLPNGTVGANYSATINFKYETKGTKYALDAYFQGLPSGVKTGGSSGDNTTIGILTDLSGKGTVTISGSPTKSGTFPVTLKIYDPHGYNFGEKKYNLEVKPAEINFGISNESMPNGYTDTAYNTQFRVYGTSSKPPITFSMTTDYPDSAVTMDRTSGMFSTNKLAKKGTWNVEVTAKDSVGLKAVKKYTFKIIDNTTTTVPALKIDTTSMPNGEAYNKYSLQFSASGGKAPYTWIVYSTTHPGSAVGINSTTGLFSNSTGMYPEEGTWTYDIQVTDALGTKIRKSYTWVVDPIGINPN